MILTPVRLLPPTVQLSGQTFSPHEHNLIRTENLETAQTVSRNAASDRILHHSANSLRLEIEKLKTVRVFTKDEEIVELSRT